METLRKPSSWGRKTQAIVFAVGIHLLVLVILGFSFNWKPNLITAGSPEPQPVQATVVSETLISEEMARRVAQEDAKRLEEQQRQQRVEDLIEQAEQLEAERQEQEQELVKLEAERKAKQEQDRVAEEQRLARVEEEAKQEKQREADELKRKQEQQRLTEEKKKKEEAERRRLAEEKKRKEEAERQRIAEEKKRKEEAARQKRLAEQRRAKEQAIQTRNDAVSALRGNFGAIQSAVSRNWIRPTSFIPGQTATVLVKVGKAGEVLEAEIVTGSGDPVFDRSVYNAVLKASPLPIPRDPRYYPHIREFNIKFNPAYG